MVENSYQHDLKKIREWRVRDLDDFRALMNFVWERWVYGKAGYAYMDFRCNTFKFHTGGVGENEDIIGALQQNEIFWMLYWEESRRGGHYTFMPVMQGLVESL